MYGKYSFFRKLAYTIEILILYVLQQTPGLFGEILGVKPVLLISAAVTISMFESQLTGLGFGILTGFLMDLGYGAAFGFNTLLMAILCYFIGFLAIDYIKTNILTAVIFGVLAVVLVLSSHYLFLYVLSNYGSNNYAYVHHYLPIILYSAIPLPILYFINRAFVIWINEKV